MTYTISTKSKKEVSVKEFSAMLFKQTMEALEKYDHMPIEDLSEVGSDLIEIHEYLEILVDAVRRHELGEAGRDSEDSNSHEEWKADNARMEG